ncbi:MULTISPECIES: hypothetical protein [Dactylosporangium]|uniref:Uncharacterized protein n=2 Tax=Dactylosporangium TaxID=35753 RepID=A0A9W6KAN0_9ACTN|nr:MULTISPECIES: hypothetical protein [Dactylosporangium]UAB97121.1 hypothetical protein Dvina_02625 [Dactylosporangium vinaceum]UWZ45408.1 hypothetical protein Dmats_02330 [Dactylosporangium matsuzakiense]GLK98605.1 hypothetical protein GCM10017581_003460 [Dactylosporangium matsuzakiense]
MGELVVLPKSGDIFDDRRGGDRTMRVTCHPQQGTVVVSLWVDRICRASFQLADTDLPRLQEALAGMQFDAASDAAPPADKLSDTA